MTAEAEPERPTPPPIVREPVFNLPPVIVALIVACAGIHLVRMYLLSPETDYALILRFAFFPIRYSGDYDLDLYAFVSPVSYSLLHGGIAHLLVNMVWLAAFGSPLANRIGALRTLLFWVATSLAAVLLHYVLHSADATPLVGASGAISGMTGAAARFGFRVDRRKRRAAFEGPVLPMAVALTSRTVVIFLAVWMAVNLISGLGYLTPDAGGAIAWEAHIGGFLAGFLGVRAFVPRTEMPRG